MTETEVTLIHMIRESDNPEKVAEYALNLFLDYLRIHGSCQEIPSAAPLESA